MTQSTAAHGLPPLLGVLMLAALGVACNDDRDEAVTDAQSLDAAANAGEATDSGVTTTEAPTSADDDDVPTTDDDVPVADDAATSVADDDTAPTADDEPSLDAGSVNGGAEAGRDDDSAETETEPGQIAPSSSWINATGNLAGLASECGNLTLLSATPDSARIIAGVAKVGLFATDDGGAHWEALGTGAGSDGITNRPSSIVYDPEHPGTFWESGIYNGGGVYKTTDDGETFVQLGDVGHNDLVSVDFTDPERKTLLVGGHEQKQTLYRSLDNGQHFEQIGANLPPDSHFSTAPLVLDGTTFLLGACGYGDGTCGIYRSEDAGDSWERVSDLAATARPLWAADGAIYWPLIYNSGLALSTDGGVSWHQIAEGIVTAPPVELPDARILSLKGRDVVVTANGGETWNTVGEPLPFDASGVTYSAQTKTLYAWHWDCGEVVLPDAIASAGFDYTRP